MGDDALTAHQKSAAQIKQLAEKFSDNPSGYTAVDSQADQTPRKEQLAAARAGHKAAPGYKLSPELQAMVDEAAKERVEKQLARAPDRAHKIETEAKLATGGDAQANLALRKDLEDLMHDPNTPYRDKVIAQVVDDGNHLFGAAPHADLKYKEGKLDAIDFSGGFTGEHVVPSLSLSVEQQREHAWTDYENTISDGRVAHGENAQLIVDRENQMNAGMKHPPTIGKKKWFEYE